MNKPGKTILTGLRRVSIFLLLVLLATQLGLSEAAFAKRSRRSFSSRRKTSGSRRTSRQTTVRSKPRKGSGFNSKTSRTTTYRSRSKTRSKKGSIFNTRAKTTSRGTSLAQAARKANSKSKFTAARKGRQTSKTYREVVTEHPRLRETLTPQNRKTRNKRRLAFYSWSKPTNRYYNYQPNTVYHDPYDNLFFRYVTLTWLFHHWHQIDKSRFDEVRLQDLEAQIARLENEGMERDPNYVLPGVDPDLQYSDAELENLQEAKEVIELEAEAEGDQGGIGWLTMFLLGMVVVGGIYFVGVRKY
jgi:hypothetical protein